eukprot:CAMPEP_0201602484 /NCGR_PEP_ID=MMETSP0492-20130828/3197_1 /ASSEMBLY_ACC=CAM_ASM_000837 /TAXON_ID=420259 /ORGANISM="Thalassiosira gravida, Strain GMp14c1" /LENGTH=487 /DNA_ID=CAMNT_0048066015 /DNA_START=198 /DNA_END=1661 /DNA_ORIENTATION=+
MTPPKEKLIKDHNAFQNWMKTTTTTPLKLIHVRSVDHIQAVVASTDKYPSPIRPTGSILSHTDIHSNDGGTTLLMSNMNKIYGIKTHRYARKRDDGTKKVEEVVCIETDPCATLREIQLYAQKYGYELPFSAEIGLATVGGTIFVTSKDSSIGKSPIYGSGLGDIGSCVFSFTVVDEIGNLCQYNLFDEHGEFDMDFQSMLDSHGTQGIAVKIFLAVRKKVPVTIDIHIAERFGGDSSDIAHCIYNTWRNASSNDGNVFAAIGCQSGFWWLEERIPTANKPNQQAPLSRVLSPILLWLKNYIFERCHMISPLRWLSCLSGSMWLRLKLDSRPAGFSYNKDIPDNERKLSFSNCAFPTTSFVDVVTEGLDFVRAYKLKYGFEPHALATIFVEQSGKRLAGGYHRKKVSKEDTHTFVFDPVHQHPKDPEWHKFLDSFHIWQRQKGGVPSITQSFHIEHQDLAWGSLAVHGKPSPRFTNNFIQQFFDAKK